MSTPDTGHPLEDYGVIGDCRTVALIARDGSIDWWSPGRFDADPTFCALLDPERGGVLQVRPRGPFIVPERRYVTDTAVLESVVETSTGRVRVTDLMPVNVDTLTTPKAPASADNGGRTIVRTYEGLAGTSIFDVRFRPTRGYGAVTAPVRVGAAGVHADVAVGVLSVCGVGRWEVDERGAAGSLTVAQGQLVTLRLHVAAPGRGGRRPGPADGDDVRRRTVEAWRQWVRRGRYVGPYADALRRSAILLKLLSHAPTGAMVAAPTTSLPENLGGARNWDYRYTWLRDTALALRSLQRLGHHDEAMAFWRWLRRIMDAAGDDAPSIAYAVDGGAVPPERTVDHLRGYGGSRPVRVGNGARHQAQHDVYGEVIAAADHCYRHMDMARPQPWPTLRRFADEAAARWRVPGAGLWELRRDADSPHVYSVALAWVAATRAAGLVRDAGVPGPQARWRRAADEMRAALLRRGYNDEVGSFTQRFDSSTLDASALAVATTGILPADDRRVQATVDRLRADLSEDGLLYRYRADDGLPGNEGTFLLASCWLAEVLAMQGRTDDAAATIDRVLACSGELGLLSEEFDGGRGRLVGNHPQALTHLGVVRAVLALYDAAPTVAAR